MIADTCTMIVWETWCWYRSGPHVRWSWVCHMGQQVAGPYIYGDRCDEWVYKSYAINDYKGYIALKKCRCSNMHCYCSNWVSFRWTTHAMVLVWSFVKLSFEGQNTLKAGFTNLQSNWSFISWNESPVIHH